MCIGHDITEVAELRPATVIARRDAREKLKCEACEGAIVSETRSLPLGGSALVSSRSSSSTSAAMVSRFIGKKERFARMGLELPVSTSRIK